VAAYASDVEAVAKTLCLLRVDLWHMDRTDDFPCSHCRVAARESVGALAEAGRLLPAGTGEPRTSWAVRWEWTEQFGGGVEVDERRAEADARAVVAYMRRSPRVAKAELVRRSEWIGPWGAVE
jgi:hypothetical protein